MLGPHVVRYGNPSATPAQSPVAAPQQSRFFPQSNDPNSPPPPESGDHPACSGNAKHPTVSLPPPKPTVKLPPAPPHAAAPDAQAAPVNMPYRFQAARPVGAQPIASSLDWKQRFDVLLNRNQATGPPSPPKTPPKDQAPAPTVTSLSKGPLDDPFLHQSTTVSLPPNATPSRPTSYFGFKTDDSHDIVSKSAVDGIPTMDAIFNEELSFGSLPRIKIPRQLSLNANMPRPPVLVYPPHIRCQWLVNPQSKPTMFETLADAEELPGEGLVIQIKFAHWRAPMERLMRDREYIAAHRALREKAENELAERMRKKQEWQERQALRAQKHS
ncbi:hypothetical protein LTR28_001760, partial [Elasticomyces elasticus]